MRQPTRWVVPVLALAVALAACTAASPPPAAQAPAPPPTTAALPKPPPRKPQPPGTAAAPATEATTSAATPSPAPAAEPAPGPAVAALEPAAPTAPPAAPAPRLDRLIGLSQPQVAQILGEPRSHAESPPATIWRYDGNDCALDVYFYLDLQSQAMRALHYEVRSHDAAERSAQRCYEALLSERRANADPAGGSDRPR